MTSTDTILNPGTSKIDEAFEAFNTMTVDISFLDASGDISSFESPINLNANSNNQLRMNVHQEKIYDFYFGQLVVNTSQGWFWKTTSKSTALKLTNTFFDSLYREPSYETTFTTSTGTSTKARPYGTMRFLASNSLTTVNRDYDTLVDSFGRIGGIAQSITFVFIFLMVYHHEIRMEQSLLNEAILQNKKDEEEEEEA
jgi:hypothetical protein